MPSGGPYRAVIEVKLGHHDTWANLLTFDLHTEKVKDNSYIAYSNILDWQP